MILIIVTSYNMDKLLAETVVSVQRQSHTDFVAVIVDDGSNNDQEEFLPVEILNDSRFRVLKQKNTGVSQARNNGVSYSKSGYDYLLFLDGDDILYPNFLEEGVKKLKREEADLFFARAERFTEALGDQDTVYGPDDSFIEGLPEVLLERSQLVPSMCLMKRDLFKRLRGFRDSKIYMEDWDFFIRAASLGEKFVFSENVLLGYRLIQDSRGGRSYRNRIECANTLKLNRHAFPGSSIRAMKTESWYLLDAACCLPRADLFQRLKLIAKAFTAFPYTLRSFKKIFLLVTFTV